MKINIVKMFCVNPVYDVYVWSLIQIQNPDPESPKVNHFSLKSRRSYTTNLTQIERNHPDSIGPDWKILIQRSNHCFYLLGHSHMTSGACSFDLVKCVSVGDTLVALLRFHVQENTAGCRVLLLLKTRKGSWLKLLVALKQTLCACEYSSAQLHIPRKWNPLCTHTRRSSTNHLLITRRAHGNKLLDDNDAIPVSTGPSSAETGGRKQRRLRKRCVSLYENPMQISFRPRGTWTVFSLITQLLSQELCQLLQRSLLEQITPLTSSTFDLILPFFDSSK